MSFQIAHPEMLLGFIPLAFLLALQLYRGHAQPSAFSWRRFFFSFLGFSFGILALARVQAGSHELKKSHGESDLYLAIDISRSMLAEDTLPNRLQFVATFGEKLLELLPKARVAVYPFTSDGFLLMPLSSDHLAAVDLLKGLSPSLSTEQGTDLSTAMETLFTAIMKRRANPEKVTAAEVVILSDGESHRAINESVFRRYKENGIPIFTVGVGTAQGAQLYRNIGMGGFRQALQDSSGKPVVSRLEKEKLEQVAKLTDAVYYPGRFDQVSALAKRLNQRVSQGGIQTSFQVQREFFPELLALAFLFLTIELFAVRWEYLVRSLILGLLLSATPAGAWTDETEAKLQESGQSRPIVSYNEALKALESGNYADAADLFLESAGTTQDMNLRKKALLNLGNTQLRQMDPVQAMAAYQQSIDTKAPNSSTERDANQRASSNLILAAKMQKQMSQSQSGQSEKKDGGESQESDPGGPKKDFKAQSMSDGQKKKIFDLISEQEREVRARLQNEKNQKKGVDASGNDW